MHHKRILLALFLIYFVFAILLNSVGTVILQVIQNYGVAKTEAAILEGFKDLPISLFSFLLASYLPRFGFQRAMLVGLALVTAACVAMPLLPSFWMSKLLFFCVGASFALVKVSVYATLGLISSSPRQHASYMNTLEGFFMLGVLSGYWIFGAFIDDQHPGSTAWLRVYWLLAALSALTFALIAATPFASAPCAPEQGGLAQSFLDMLRLFALPLVFVFIICAFLYVLLEQGIGTWLPTFNNEVLKLTPAMSVQATSIFAACLAIGRLSAGVVMRRFHWYPVLNFCLICMAALVLLSLPLASNIPHQTDLHWANAPLAAFIFPLIGLFMAPIYPGINSVMLSALPTHQHAAMTGLLVIFSALGGTTGSLITGYVFGHMNGQTAFYLSLIPLALLLLSLAIFKRSLPPLIPIPSHP